MNVPLLRLIWNAGLDVFAIYDAECVITMTFNDIHAYFL